MDASLTVNGLTCQPQTVLQAHHNRLVPDKTDFAPKAVLRRNVKALMGTKEGPRSQNALAEKSGVAQATIGRILSEDGVDAGIETVEKIAKAYGLEAWQLMVAGMDPTNPPVLQPVSKEERAFYDRVKALYQDVGKYR